MPNYRKIFEQHYGVKIPKGYHIHHKDMNHENNDPLNLEALTPDDHAQKHGFLNNWIMAMAIANQKTRSKQWKEQKSLAMRGKKHALGCKHSEEMNKQKSVRLVGNKNALGIVWSEERRLEWSNRLTGKKRGPYKKKD